MNIRYKSTRGDGTLINSSEAILKGLADDRGLYVPEQIPALDIDLQKLAEFDYKRIAFEVLKRFLGDFSDEEIAECVENAYDEKFDTSEIAPVVKKGGRYFLELFHGPTIAFKDMALSILPHLLLKSAKKNGVDDEIVILTATSGDTGKAALSGFADVEGTRIIVFYPKGGVSHIQELQMLTQKGANTFVCGVNGNFDDAQTGVKNIFSDPAINAELNSNGFRFSSANSINIGRLIPQVAYYVYSYSRLVRDGQINAGDKINFVVPTGNFGNILAGFYAKKMGLPVNKLICASNENKVLFDFFGSGTYDKNRDFILTSSPSMDILISSNLERLIYMITGEDEEQLKSFMKDLQSEGKYAITEEMRKELSDFVGGFAAEDENFDSIKRLYEETGYIIDTHTGVANCVYEKYLENTNDSTPTVIVSTASPYKFARSVMKAVKPAVDTDEDLALIDELEKLSGVEKPKAIKEIINADILHDTVCDTDKMQQAIKGFLDIE